MLVLPTVNEMGRTRRRKRDSVEMPAKLARAASLTSVPEILPGSTCARRIGVCSFALGWVLLMTEPAQAAAPGAGASFDEARVNYQPPPATRRDGFAMGLSYGVGLGSFSGFPLEAAALNDPSQEVSTGPGLATNFSFWLGGALRDFLTFGLGVTTMSTSGSKLGVEPAFLVHIEAFPLFYRGGFFEDFGVAFDGGLGIGFIGEKGQNPAEEPLAEGGSMSLVGLETFWEPLRFWNVSAGPSLSYRYSFSQSMQVHQGMLGFRMALYGVQPKKRKQQTETASRGGF